tara:strand:- start:1407 stop:1583 length:177 start_codon:yes stop_codon:yes gene_type:complete
MPKEYSGHVVGKVGNRAVPPAGGNKPAIPPKPAGNRFAKEKIAGKSHQNLDKSKSIKY